MKIGQQVEVEVEVEEVMNLDFHLNEFQELLIILFVSQLFQFSFSFDLRFELFYIPVYLQHSFHIITLASFFQFFGAQALQESLPTF